MANMDTLTDKERQFVLAYVGDAGANRTKAARMAGYSSKSQSGLTTKGHELMNKPAIRRAIDELYAERAGDMWERKDERIKMYQDMIDRIHTSFRLRAAQYQRLGVTPELEIEPGTDPEMERVAQNAWLLEHIPDEALMGTYIREVTVTASGTRIVKWVFDGQAVKELRELHKQLAVEKGQWIENRNVTNQVSFNSLKELAQAAMDAAEEAE